MMYDHLLEKIGEWNNESFYMLIIRIIIMVDFVSGNELWILGSCSLHLVFLASDLVPLCALHLLRSYRLDDEAGFCLVGGTGFLIFDIVWNYSTWTLYTILALKFETLADLTVASVYKAFAQSNRSKSLEESRRLDDRRKNPPYMTPLMIFDFCFPVWMTLSTTWPRLRSQPTVQLTSSCCCSQAKWPRFYLKDNLVPLDLSSLQSFKEALTDWVRLMNFEHHWPSCTRRFWYALKRHTAHESSLTLQCRDVRVVSPVVSNTFCFPVPGA